ncbi:Cof-type HAD-IIB family hydrolase [Lactobacillus sp. ESL0731]|uniref:Cof-type HAD-IIB family hydrolase n=1 Tax=unclassified Lactobacillus TaxID=2620435 RepID=UPI0023F7FB53|nr:MULTISPECIES: Cof-type HAD-IIB family hydrolase [unclassified Lactobacillus]WEV51810.1 Cof-type HAD-IIB family hydrolase [Lactobacillus sp. ESL0700]WEV62939.1 Cof-type HAD-IIB family hydrolase [Lactobacillus sp. ESL0731]
MAIKLVAVDLDGTLLTTGKQIMPETERVLKQISSQGIKVVLATGRPLSGVMPYNQQLGLSGSDQYNIVFNGAVIQNLAGKVMMDMKMDYRDFTNMLRLQRLAHTNLHFETPECFWTCDRDLAQHLTMNVSINLTTLKVRKAEEIPQDFTFNKVGFSKTESDAEVDKLWNNIPDWVFAKYDVVRSFSSMIELNVVGASKGNALMELADRLKIDQQQVMVFGDQGNDISMFSNPYFRKVAMGNATEQIKDAADYVTADNDHDGIAKALKKLVL